MIKWTAVMLVIGFLLDLLIGDPRWLYHPVRIIGNNGGMCFSDSDLSGKQSGSICFVISCI